MKNILLVIGSLLFWGLLFELGLRLVPVGATSSFTQAVDPSAPYLHFKPNHSFRFARDWAGKQTITHHSNDYGFAVPWDFGPYAVNATDAATVDNDRAPVSTGIANSTASATALIGDSYVEALHVHPEQSVGALLQGTTDKPVLPLATSGAPLSQYLAYMRFAKDNFQPERYIVLVVENDFDESLLARRTLPGRFYFDEVNNMRSTLVNFQPSTTSQVLQHSRLAQYLVKNLSLARVIASRGIANTDGNTDQSEPETLFSRSAAASTHFLNEALQLIGNPSQILFVVDGRRRSLYLQPNEDANLRDRLLLDFIEQSRAAGFQTIDLEDVFSKHHESTGEKLEFADDYHWNATGHALAAKAIQDSGFIPTR